MADVVVVFDRTGKPLDELNVSVVRHLKLDHSIDLDRGVFSISVTDPKATARNLKRNNFVLVTSDQIGIKPWCAVMWPDENTGLTVNTNAEYVIPLRGVESILAQRLTGVIETINPPASPGAIFMKILRIAQVAAAFPPLSQSSDAISMVGTPTNPTWNLMDCYNIVNQMAVDNDMYWGFSASRDFDVSTGKGTGKLILTPYFLSKIGKKYRTTLIARGSGGTNAAADSANLVGSQIQEKSMKPFANRIVAYGQMDNWSDAVTNTVNDEKSQGEYGIVAAAAEFTTITSADALLPAARRELKMCSHRLYVDGTLINVSAFPSIGDVCLVQPDYSGAQFLANKYGTTLRMRVKETNYSPLNNTMAVNLEGLFDDE
jgi:hypothetical protein